MKTHRHDNPSPYLPQDLQQLNRRQLQNQWDHLQELIETRTRQLQATEQALRQSQDFLDKIINSLADPLFVKDASFRYILANDAACTLAAQPRQRIIGSSDELFFPPETAAFIHEKDSQLLQQGGQMRYELQTPGPDGDNCTLQVRKSRYIDPQGGAFIVGIIRDVTEHIVAEQQKSNYARHLNEAIEQERSRLSRELHDGLGHALTEQSFLLKRLQGSLPDNGTSVRQTFDQLQQGTRQMVQTVQRLCSNLRPSLLDDLGLEAAIEWLLEDMHRTCGINVTLSWYGPIAPEIEQHSTELFRIVQESANNIMKHSRADQVAVLFYRTGTSTVLEISDNGCGFTTNAAPSCRSFGIIGMQERAALLGGSLQICSSPNQGTTVRLLIQHQSGEETDARSDR
jgi:hypothetical protein